ncbi:hypothetical protein D3C84_622120 [compost metagenome]
MVITSRIGHDLSRYPERIALSIDGVGQRLHRRRIERSHIDIELFAAGRVGQGQGTRGRNAATRTEVEGGLLRLGHLLYIHLVVTRDRSRPRRDGGTTVFRQYGSCGAVKTVVLSSKGLGGGLETGQCGFNLAPGGDLGVHIGHLRLIALVVWGPLHLGKHVCHVGWVNHLSCLRLSKSG